MDVPIKPFSAGESLSAARMNELLRFANRTLRATPPLYVLDVEGGGQTIRLATDELVLGSIVVVKITGNATGGGKYLGKIFRLTRTADIAQTGNLAEAEIGTLPSANDAIVVNLTELGLSTHDLTNGTPKVTVYLGKVYHINSADPKYVVVIGGFDWEACT